MMNRSGKIFLIPTDISLLAYMAISGFFIIIFHHMLSDTLLHLGSRLLFIMLLFAMAFLEIRNPGVRAIQLTRRFLPFALLGYLYNELDYLNNIIIADDLDPMLASAEERLFGIQPALEFAKILDLSGFAEAMYLGYFSYYLLVFLIPLYLFLGKGSEMGERWIFILINSFMIFYLMFIFIPAGGPQFYFTQSAETVPGGYVFGALTRFIQANLEVPAAAFPSSHVSICLILVWACYRQAPRLLIVVMPLSLLMLLSTVYIRAHYVIDVLAAFIITPVIFILSDRFYNILAAIKPTSHRS